MRRHGGSQADRLREDMLSMEERKKNQDAYNKEQAEMMSKNNKYKRDAQASLQ